MVEERIQRRLATILAADVAGYSRLMGADEEGTLATLKAYREVIDGLIGDHHGRVFGPPPICDPQEEGGWGNCNYAQGQCALQRGCGTILKCYGTFTCKDALGACIWY